MESGTESLQINILHVLTLNGRNGEYGGPVRVARELCQELNSRGHKTHIFSGALVGSEPKPSCKLSESFIHVKPITQRLKVSSLWSWKLIPPLKNLIRNADIIHIHFARDLIPFLAAFLAIILRKPFITQTHGMIIFDGRISTRVTDLFLTRPLLNKSRLNLVLTDYEASAVEKIRMKSLTTKLPNGIAMPLKLPNPDNLQKRIVFCSRLDKRKGLGKFINLAQEFKDLNLKFEVYGPDGGELQFLKSEIENRGIANILEYKGSLPSDQVQVMLSGIDLLVLPSKDEPFPMVVLEALSVGTSVLVMPSCGFAYELKKFDTNFVAIGEEVEGLIQIFQFYVDSDFIFRSRDEVRDFCTNTFGISNVTDKLNDLYKQVLSYE